MADRVLSLAMLVAWQLAMLSTAEAHQGLVGAVSSLVVGITMIVLLVSAADHDAAPADADEAALFERLLFQFPVH